MSQAIELCLSCGKVKLPGPRPLCEQCRREGRGVPSPWSECPCGGCVAAKIERERQEELDRARAHVASASPRDLALAVRLIDADSSPEAVRALAGFIAREANAGAAWAVELIEELRRIGGVFRG